jgi:hypothetical protein
MHTNIHRRLLLIVTGCTAGLVFVASVSVSCGSVKVKDACAQGCPDVAMFESRLADLEERVGRPSPGAVGIGTVIAHSTHIAGSTSIAEMRTAGFAVCDGTTPLSQGITDAVLTGPTPDLNGRFLRGAATSGDLQTDATAAKNLTGIPPLEARTITG